MRGTTWMMMCAAVLAVTGMARAQQYADVLGDYSPGASVDDDYYSGILLDDPNAALGGPGIDVLLGVGDHDGDGGTPDVPIYSRVVSLGSYSGGGGLVLGFSGGVTNGAGADLRIVGNAFFGAYEPAFVEVAIETDGGGATAGGWSDETFYLIKPSNFAALAKVGNDPRAAAQSIPHGDFDGDGFSEYGVGPFATPPTGYADVTAGGDLIDLSDAIDAAGDPAALAQIAYIRMRSVTDDEFDYVYDFVPYGTNPITAEIDYIENLQAPEPTALGLMMVGAAGVLRRRRR
jgi:hypothetical protein